MSILSEMKFILCTERNKQLSSKIFAPALTTRSNRISFQILRSIDEEIEYYDEKNCAKS
jgi:hypothetical protein